MPLVPEQDRRLGELAREVVLRGVDLALQLVAERGEAVDPGADLELPAADASSSRWPSQRSLPRVDISDSRQRRSPLRRARTWAPSDLVAVAEDRRRDLEPVAGGRLHGVTAAVDDRRHLLDLDPPRRFLRSREGHGRSSLLPRDDLKVETPASSSGILLHPTSLPGGRLGPEARASSTGSRGGPVVVADAAAGAARTRPARRTSRRLRSRAGAACWRSRARRSPPRRWRRSSRRTRTGRATGRRFAGAGAIADQVRFQREWMGCASTRPSAACA